MAVEQQQQQKTLKKSEPSSQSHVSNGMHNSNLHRCICLLNLFAVAAFVAELWKKNLFKSRDHRTEFVSVHQQWNFKI